MATMQAQHTTRKFSMQALALFVMATSAWGETYYLRSDGTAAVKEYAVGPCENYAACMSLSVSNLQSYAPGDTVYLCETGGVLRGTLAPLSNGSPTAPITYKNHPGHSPIISGAGMIIASAWGNLTANVWTASDDHLPFAVLFDGAVGTRVFVLPSAPGEWGYSDGVLYVFSSGNPALIYSSPGIEVMYYDAVVDIRDKSWITIYGLIVERSNAWGVLIRGAAASNNTVHNCTVRYCGLTGIQIDTGAGYPHHINGNTVYGNWGDGISGYRHSAASGSEVVVENNTVYGNGICGIQVYANRWIVQGNNVFQNGTRPDEAGSGIKAFDDKNGSGSWGDNNLFRFNSVSGQGGLPTDANGIQIDHYSDNNVIVWNTIHGNNGQGISVYKARGTKVISNLVFDNNLVPHTTINGEIVIWDDSTTDRTRDTNIISNVGRGSENNAYAVVIQYDIINNRAIKFSDNFWSSYSENWYNYGGTPGKDIAIWNALPIVDTDAHYNPFLSPATPTALSLRP